MEKAKVMVVDDEEKLLSIIKLNLEQTGKYEVMTLSSPKVLHSINMRINARRIWRNFHL